MRQEGFARLIIIVVIAIALLFAFRVISEHFLGINPIKFEGFKKQESSVGKNTNDFFQGTGEGNCKKGEIAKFEAEFTDLEKINAINPIGGIGGGSPGRSYIGVKKGMETSVYSPTDAVLENIIFAKRPKDPIHSLTDMGKGEYGLYIRLSCDVTVLFDHIDRVSDKILAVAPKEPSESSRVENPPVNLKIKKGELLGYTDGTPQARTFDFLIIDRAKPTTHINPKRWEWEQAVYAQCPYDFFVPELKEKYYAKIGESTEVSRGPTFYPAGNCGQLSHDVEGTISGGWFKGESTDTKGDYLAIAKATATAGRVEVAVKKDGLFGPDSVIHDYTPKVFPEDVGVGEEACYFDSNTNMWAYAKLISEKKLSFARGTNVCPSSFPESQAEVWER